MFVESVPYFSPLVLGITFVFVPLPLSMLLPAPAFTDSSSVPPEDTSEPHASTPVRELVKDF